MKKVLHILSSDKFSGAENVVCQIIRMFNNNTGYKMSYCSPYGDIENVLKEKSIEYIPIKKLSVKQIKKVIKKYNPDIIHAHDAKASVICALACKSKTIISHIHGNHDNMKIPTIKSISYFLFKNKFRHIFWVSNSSLEGYKYNKYIKDRSSVLYNVINVEDIFKCINEDRNSYNYECIFIGRLCDIKNPKRLVGIIKKITEDIPKIKCAIVGDGYMKNELVNLINMLGLSSNINMLGFMKNPLKILQDSKVMIMTSKYEGTPMCALEAMAVGVPIVSTPTDGMIDIVKQDITGYLSNEDNILAEKVISIIKDKEKYSEMSKASQLHFKEINNIENYKQRLIEVYEYK